MKNIYAILLAVLIGSPVFASHIKGAEIYYDHNSGNSYDIYFLAYRDATGITLPQSLTLAVTGHSTITQVSLASYSTYTEALACNASVEYKLYKSTINLGAIPANGITFSWVDCCRPTTITNLANPGNQSLYIETKMYPNPGTSVAGSSPRYYRNAALVGLSGELNEFNTGAFDPDPMDSIHVSLVSARGNSATNNLVYNSFLGYSFGQPFGSTTTTTLDAKTGMMSVLNPNVGTYITATKIESFRNGSLTSSINRDVSYNIVSSTDSLSNTGIFNLTTNGIVSTSNNSYYVEMNTTDSLEFTVTGLISTSDSLELRGFGTLLTNNSGNGGNCAGSGCASFVASNGSFINSMSTSGEFLFAPNSSNVPTGAASANYYLVFESTVESTCGVLRNSSVAIMIKLNKITSISSQDSLNLCQGGMVQAQVMGDTTNLLWTPSTGVSNVTSSNPYLFPTTSTTYTVTNLNDSTQIMVHVAVDSLAGPTLGSSTSLAYIPNYTDYDGAVWYYNGVVIAMNVDSISTPISGDYFAMVSKGACSAFSDTISISTTNGFPVHDANNGSALVANLYGNYQIAFSVNAANSLNTVTVFFPNPSLNKTSTPPVITLMDDQNNVLGIAVAASVHPGIWTASGLNVSLMPNQDYFLDVQADSGQVVLFQPDVLPYTDPSNMIEVAYSTYDYIGGPISGNAFPYMVFGMQSTIGIDESEINASIYPVPMNDKLIIELDGTVDFELYDITGRLVKSEKIKNSGVINTNDLANGVYIYKMTKGDKIKTGKLYK